MHEAIGRLKERYPRVARYYALAYDAPTRTLTWTEHADRKARAERLDGAYVLKTDRQDLSDEEIWRLYILLTRVEAAFRDLKSPLMPATNGKVLKIRKGSTPEPIHREDLPHPPDPRRRS